MAEKRSSKTARVLNLITHQGGETPEQTTEEVRQPEPVPQEEKKTVKRKPAKASAPSRKPAKQKKTEEQAASEQQPSAMPEQQASTAPEQQASAGPERMAQSAPPPVVPIVQTTKDREKALSDEIRAGLLQALEAETDTTPAQAVAEETSPDENAVDNMLSTEPAEQKTICFPSQGAEEEHALVTPHGEKDVQYINVLQELVEEEAAYYVENMLQCRCARCVADMKALALTNLPSKYVVLDSKKRNAMMSLYAARYDNLLSVQMMRACVLVNENPHH